MKCAKAEMQLAGYRPKVVIENLHDWTSCGLENVRVRVLRPCVGSGHGNWRCEVSHAGFASALISP